MFLLHATFAHSAALKLPDRRQAALERSAFGADRGADDEGRCSYLRYQQKLNECVADALDRIAKALRKDGQRAGRH
jgi:hypothetical protein